jgi:AcrR family transcriptional regulator
MVQVSTQARKPKTARGKKTRDRLLQAAESEFGEKGFHDAGISGITYRAGVALGTFYTYFESKEEIFRALVRYMSRRTREHVARAVGGATDRLSAERRGIEAFIRFAREHKAIYRIITEAEFVAPKEYREHYAGFAAAYQANLEQAAARGDIRAGDFETWSWALMGMVVFLGMRFAEWDDSRPAGEIADIVIDLMAKGIAAEEHHAP